MMDDNPLPNNDTLLEFSEAIPWHVIEDKKIRFNDKLKALANSGTQYFPLDEFSDAIDAPVVACMGTDDPNSANILMAKINGKQFVLGSVVSGRYRSGKTFTQAMTSYHLNPSVNHTNIAETDHPTTRIRAIGAELELGLLHPNGEGPTEDEMQAYIKSYHRHARQLGITPQIDREACQYQVEAHVAPSIGYHRTRSSLEGIMRALMTSSTETGLNTAIFSSYPIKSDFKLADDPKVHTAVDLMVEVNSQFDEYGERLKEIKQRYKIEESANVVETFRLQGCHIHLDLAGRSEALGLLTFYTLLRSATAIANGAVLKGGPFVNGTCDAELLCTREYLRSGTVTGRYFEMPVTPHLTDDGLSKFSGLLKSERVNAMARALLYEDKLGTPISAMHNPLGRVRPDLGTSKRICTVESTGMSINVSASRQAAILTDFEYSHALMENYFRKHGCNLEPMYEDQTLWEILGPLSTESFITQQNHSDRACTDIVLTTASGREATLSEFYEMKRLYMHKHLSDVAHIAPRDIDDVYSSLQRMLAPLSGNQAETIEQYVYDYKLRSTGNWGRILQNAFIEEGGVLGTHNPDAVLKVVNRVHTAISKRYLQG